MIEAKECPIQLNPKHSGPLITAGFGIILTIERFSYIGHFWMYENVLVAECRNIRRWGTSKGLAQLVNEGVQKETILDGQVRIIVPTISLVHILLVDERMWNKSLTLREL